METKSVLLRLPEDLVARIDDRAEKVGTSRNTWAERALTWAVEQPVTKRTREERI